MTTAYDIKLDDDGDLYIDPVKKDIVLEASDRRHIKDVLNAAPGHFKEFPLVGWDPFRRLNARYNKLEGNQSAKTQLQADGWTVRALNIELGADGTATLTELDVFRP
jgi:hypothetical protein